MSREEATELAQAAGARVASSVSKKTSFVVAGESPAPSSRRRRRSASRSSTRPSSCGDWRDVKQDPYVRYRGAGPLMPSAQLAVGILARVAASSRDPSVRPSLRDALGQRHDLARPAAEADAATGSRPRSAPRARCSCSARGIAWCIWQHNGQRNLCDRGVRPAFHAGMGGGLVVRARRELRDAVPVHARVLERREPTGGRLALPPREPRWRVLAGGAPTWLDRRSSWDLGRPRAASSARSGQTIVDSRRRRWTSRPHRGRRIVGAVVADPVVRPAPPRSPRGSCGRSARARQRCDAAQAVAVVRSPMPPRHARPRPDVR